MKADYRKIAENYDRTRAQEPAKVDPFVVDLIRKSLDKDSWRALDLGCGTGNYLKAQVERGPAEVTWEGLDASEDMLEIARSKLPESIALSHGDACDLPFEDATFDFVALQAVFHHFPDKDKALDEINRVLLSGGGLHIRNGAYEYRNSSWIYRFFPKAKEIDEQRFWSVDRLFDALVDRGYSPHAKINHQKQFQDKHEVVRWAENRDLSQLSILDDEAYEKGMRELHAEPGESILTEWATLDLYAVKP